MEFTTEMLETVFKTMTEDHYNGNTTSQSNMTEDGDGDGNAPRACWEIYDKTEGSVLYSDFDRILITVVMPIIMIIGVTGNALIIYAFLRVKNLRTVTNYYLVNLAVVDLSILCLAVSQKLATYLYSDIKLLNDSSLMGDSGCKAYIYAIDTLQLVSCFLIIAVSFERYLGICWPLKSRALQKPSSAVAVSFACWLVAALVKLPIAVFAYQETFCLNWIISRMRTVLTYYPKEHVVCLSCDLGGPNCMVYYHIDQIGYALVAPYLTIVYLLIIRELRRQTKSTQESAALNILQRNKNVVRMLVFTVLVYAVCTVPFRIFNLFSLHNLVPEEANWLGHVGRVALYINSLSNPIIYSLASKLYRQAFREAFKIRLPVIRCPKKARVAIVRD